MINALCICYAFIIQLIFLQQYFLIPVSCNITQYCMGPGVMRYPSNHNVELVHSNGKLLGTSCEKGHDAVVVMDNKYLLAYISRLLHSWAAF